MSAQSQHTLRHNLKHRALHVNPLLQLCIDPLYMSQQLLFIVQPLLDQFKEEMMPKVPQNVFELLNMVKRWAPLTKVHLEPLRDQMRAWARRRIETRRSMSRISTWVSSGPWSRAATTSSQSC